MLHTNAPRTTWRTSSYSVNAENCVEVRSSPDGVDVRDSKNPAGPILAFPGESWAAFLTGEH